jgi:hypothetical protein
MKTRMTWSEIKGALHAQRGAAARPRPAQEFWAEFQGRVALHPQHAPAPRSSPSRAYGWVAAGGVLAAAVVGVGTYLLGGYGAVASGGSIVRSYTVGVKHSAVVLLTDQSAQATILWVAGMESTGKEEL